MLQNAYLLAKIGADTAENEQNFAQNFAQNLPELWQLPYGATAGPSPSRPHGLPAGARFRSSDLRRRGSKAGGGKLGPGT